MALDNGRRNMNDHVLELIKCLRKMSAENPSPRDCIDEAADKLGALAAEVVHWRDEWSEVCNENQILINTCDESLAFIKELTNERDAWATVLTEIAQINPYDTSSMGFVVAKAQAAILRHNAI